jgi:hypothetical protein
MLAGTQPNLRKIEHLTGEMPNLLANAQIAVAALAHPRDVIDDLVRDSDRFQMPTPMALLPATLTTRRTPQTLRRRLREPI